MAVARAVDDVKQISRDIDGIAAEVSLARSKVQRVEADGY